MEHLEVRNGTFSFVKIALGIFNFIIAILIFIYFFHTGKPTLFIIPVIIALSGVYMATNGFGLKRAWFRTNDNYITIKWIDRIMPIQIHDSSISKISLERTRIVIYQKMRKPLNLNLGYIGQDQKTAIYSFLTAYTKQRNLILERHSGTLL